MHHRRHGGADVAPGGLHLVEAEHVCAVRQLANAVAELPPAQVGVRPPQKIRPRLTAILPTHGDHLYGEARWRRSI